MNPYMKNLKKIEFIVTMACTGKCRHCSEGDHDGCSEHIDAAIASEAVQKIYFDDSAAPVSPYEEDPEDIRTISFEANGNVLNGNVYHTDILEIIRTYRPYHVLSVEGDKAWDIGKTLK